MKSIGAGLSAEPQMTMTFDSTRSCLLLMMLSTALAGIAGAEPPRFGRFVAQEPTGRAARAIAFEPASGEAPAILQIDADGRLIGDPSAPTGLRDLESDPDGRVVVTGDQGTFIRESVGGDWRQLGALPGQAVAIGGDPRRIVMIGSPGSESDGTVRAIDPSDGSVLWSRAGAYPGARGIAVISDGSSWIADSDRHRMVRLASDGVEMLAVGDRGAFPGLFNTPSDVSALDDRIFVADMLNHRISTHRATDGGFIDQWGMHAVVPRQGEGRIHYPERVAISPDGALVAVLEPFERRYQVFGGLAEGEEPSGASLPGRRGVESHFGFDIDAAGGFLAMWEPESGSVLAFDTRYDIPIHVTTFALGGPPPAGVGRLASIAVDGERDDVWLLDAGHRRISRWMLRTERPGELVFDPFMGRFARGWTYDLLARRIAAFRAESTSPWIEPVDLLVRGDRVHVLDAAGPSIIVADRDLEIEQVIDLPEDLGPVQFAIEIGADEETMAWVLTDPAAGVLRRVDPDGVVETIPLAGTDVREPHGISIADGRLVISDRGSDEVVMLDGTGALLLRTGETGAWDGGLWRPAGTTVLPNGVVAVVDQGNHRAQGFDARTGDWRVSFSLGQGHDKPILLKSSFVDPPEEEPAEQMEEQPETSKEAS